MAEHKQGAANVDAAASRAAGGAVWAAIGRWGMSLITFITLALNARLLGAELFGVHALAMAMVAFGELLVSGTLAEALLQRRELSDDERRAAFWIAAPIGVALYLIFSAAASLVPGQVGVILPLTALALPFAALASAPVAMLMRDLRYKELTRVELVATALSSVVGVSLALAHAGVYSLVCMELTRVLLRCAGAYLITRYNPGPPAPWTAIRSVLSFGIKGLAIAFLSLVDRQIPRLVIGVCLGAAALGVFTLAMKLFETLSRLVLGPMSAVAMSVTSSLQHDMVSLRRIVLASTTAAAALSAPIFLGLAAVAPLLVPLGFGDPWSGAVLPAQILMLIGLRGSVSAFTVPILRGLGNSRAPFILGTVGAIFTAVFTLVAAPFGLAAITIGMLVRSLLTWPIGAHFLHQATGLSLIDQARAGAPPVFAASFMAAIVWLFSTFAGPHLHAWITLTLSATLGALLYFAALHWLAPHVLRAVLHRLQIPRATTAASHLKP